MTAERGNLNKLLHFQKEHQIFYLMIANATTLYRSPERIFAAADRGESVVIRRRRVEYILVRKASSKRLYGSNADTIRRDSGKPKASWKAIP